MRLGLVCVMFVGAVGCESNPTPHPGVADSRVNGGDISGATGHGPDDDQDGVPDCDEAGGNWTGSACNLTDAPIGPTDAVEGGDTGAPPGMDVYVDGEAGEVGEVGGGADDATRATGAIEAGPSD